MANPSEDPLEKSLPQVAEEIAEKALLDISKVYDYKGEPSLSLFCTISAIVGSCNHSLRLLLMPAGFAWTTVKATADDTSALAPDITEAAAPGDEGASEGATANKGGGEEVPVVDSSASEESAAEPKKKEKEKEPSPPPTKVRKLAAPPPGEASPGAQAPSSAAARSACVQKTSASASASSMAAPTTITVRPSFAPGSLKDDQYDQPFASASIFPDPAPDDPSGKGKALVTAALGAANLLAMSATTPKASNPSLPSLRPADSDSGHGLPPAQPKHRPPVKKPETAVEEGGCGKGKGNNRLVPRPPTTPPPDMVRSGVLAALGLPEPPRPPPLLPPLPLPRAAAPHGEGGDYEDTTDEECYGDYDDDEYYKNKARLRQYVLSSRS
jgi:hypothetical protein